MLTTDALQLPRHEAQPARPPLRNRSNVRRHLRLLGHPPRHAVPHALRGQSQRAPNIFVGPPRGLLRAAVCPEHARVLHHAPRCTCIYLKPLGLDAGMRGHGCSDVQRAFDPLSISQRTVVCTCTRMLKIQIIPQVVLGDAVVWWRVWVVWNKNRPVLAACCFVLFATLGAHSSLSLSLSVLPSPLFLTA